MNCKFPDPTVYVSVGKVADDQFMTTFVRQSKSTVSVKVSFTQILALLHPW